MEQKILRLNWREYKVDVKVDVDKCTMLDIVLEFEEEARKKGYKLDYAYPTFGYSYKMENRDLETDKDLMLMFERLSTKKMIDIWVGTVLKPNGLYKLVLNLRRQNEKNRVISENVETGEDNGSTRDEQSSENVALDELEDTSVGGPTKQSKSVKNKNSKVPPKPPKKAKNIHNLPPPPISPNTAFQSLPIRRSPRFSPILNTTVTAPTIPAGNIFNRKIPKTTARRKGLTVESSSVTVIDMGQYENTGRSVKRRVEFRAENVTRENEEPVSDDGYQVKSENGRDDLSDDIDSDGEVIAKGDIREDECETIKKLPKFKDNWKPGNWNSFIDDEDDDDYFQTLYKNGELYEDKEIGKIVLKPWMIFMDKQHFKDTLKDYCVQEGFAINVLHADNTRYTGTCYAEGCGWRIHASILPDGVTWAIKRINPNVHSCTGLEIHNPICTSKWAATKLSEDIRANPDIPGKALNELLFQRFGLYMKTSTLYKMKKYAVEKLFGGHDESYSYLPAYTRVICDTNPESRAFCSYVESETIPRKLLFDHVFISFSAMWKGLLGGCRPLIGVDGAHLKGNYGGVLLSAVAMDANNEIFPIAYAVVSVEDKANWSFFLWNLYMLVKDSNREDWTIISDRQKGIDLALEEVWPGAKRRYCCRHLSSNYKKQFPGPLMYTLFWRACNATSQFTFRKAINRLKEAGGDEVMDWFGKLGDPCAWSKHKFDPNVCNDSNTSNFVESFNSTLGVDRCKPVLTLLEGVRRVCMVRIGTRLQAAENWQEDDLCPKIIKAVKEISKNTISCKAYMSKPGEYEIHEGKSQFPLSLNSKICSCGAWQISGIPCRHAIRAMLHAKIDPNKVVSSWYSVKTYRQIYNYNIHPIADKDSWPEYEGLPTIVAPALKRGVGRPSRNRRREQGEDPKGKRCKTVKCKTCGHFGHNARTCKGAPTAKELKEAAPKLVRHPRVRDQSNSAKTARAAARVAKNAEKGSEGAGTSTRKKKSGNQGGASQASQASVLTASQTQQQG